MELSGRNIALTACAAIAGIAVSAAAYDYFFSPTDEQEFSQAMHLCEQCEELIFSIDRSYESTVALAGLGKEHYKPYHDYMPYDNQAWHAISAGNIRYPFLTYVNTLGKSIQDLLRYEDTVNQTRTRIHERRMKLLRATAQADCHESMIMESAIESYDFALQELQSVGKILKSKRKDLQKIQQWVMTSTQYIIEQQQARIEELEKKLSNSYIYATHSPTTTWYNTPQPTRHLYIHNTHTTHITGTIHHNVDNPDTNASAGAEQVAHPQPSAPSAQDIELKKKINVAQNSTTQQDDVWRDRFSDIGDNFNG